MKTVDRTYILTLCAAGALAVTTSAQESARSNCKVVHAVMFEQRVTTGCKPEHAFCFLGEVSGNHGMRGTTYFKGDPGAVRPPTSPDFVAYSGPFEYTLDDGMLFMRETGLSNTSQGNPESGAVTALQRVVEGTGGFAGATGYLFVNGFSRNGRVETSITGQICVP